MGKKIPNVWAKKEDNSGVFMWLPLKQHLMDAMNISELLWEHWLSEGQRELIADAIIISDAEIAENRREIAKKIIRFSAGVHDIGKAIPAFQTQKTPYTFSTELDNRLIEKLGKDGFCDLENLVLNSRSQSPHGLAGESLLRKYGVNEGVRSLVGGHHGKPTDTYVATENQLEGYPANYYQSENPQNKNHIRWDRMQSNIFEWALNVTGFSSGKEIPSICQYGLILIEGLLIMSDWIASNDKYFPLIEIDDDGSDIDQQRRLEEGWTRWIKNHIWRPETVQDINQLYKERFSFEPREVQEKITDTIQNLRVPGVVIVEAPMGIGKTEAALIAVEQLAEKTGRSGLFFGLPTQATSDGIFQRILNWLERIAENDQEGKSVRLVHGKAALNDDFMNLAAGMAKTEIDGKLGNSVATNAWFSGKKTAILDDFVVGTVDHFLLSALKQKHLALRHLGLSKKVVVIDEVHAYDAYMGQYLYQAIYWMGIYRVPTIILSATLPSQRRVELIKNYLRGRGLKWREVKKPADLESSIEYPLITYSDGSTVEQVIEFGKADTMNVHVKRIGDDKLIETIKHVLSDGGIAGIVVNTVKRAQELAKALAGHFKKEEIEVLHSGYIATHRKEKEKRLLNTIGRDGKRPEKKIIIGTQVIEQSLDIDFDVLFSDLAPMDLLLQRIGRLHRHLREGRKKEVSNPVVYILGCSEEFMYDEGSLAVYGGYLLMRTQHFLPSQICLPRDISDLVQKVYGGGEISEIPQDVYLKAKEAEQKRCTRKENKAKGYRVDDQNEPRENSLVGWLSDLSPADSEERSMAQVRDSQDSVEVVVKCLENGYTWYCGGQDISNKVTEPIIAKKLATQTLKLPSVFSQTWSIEETISYLEEYNMSNLSDWQEQPWLKGSLGIILDDNNCFPINGYKLSYDSELGVSVTREDE